MSARDDLARLLFITDNYTAEDPAHEWEVLTRHATVHVQYVYDMADALLAAGYGDVRQAQAQALEDAAQDFEDNMGVTEFDEWARRDGARWTHIEDAWEYQGPYMDWLRARAATVRGVADA
jgi:hypothetical protein